MHIQELNGKTVCILGFGREGRAMLQALEEMAPEAEVTIADADPALAVDAGKHGTQMGSHWLQNLDTFDVVIKSPGIPPSALAGINRPYATATQVFFDSIAQSGTTVVGVTGSKGKSTTASLIHHILQTGNGKPETRNILIGNIGEPAIAHLADAAKGTIFVMELSSYQLMDLTVSPHIAVITSFFPEHLDYHGSLEAYAEAKKNIVRFQGEEDIVVFAAEGHAAEIAKEGNGRKMPIEAEDAPVPVAETHLIGAHNQSNIALAFAVAKLLGIKEELASTAIRTFRGLPHRLQSLGVQGGIEWVDDAISTTPESTIAALDALGDRVHTIILGGQDRGSDFTQLAKRIKESSITTVLLFPGSGPRIKQALEDAKVEATLQDASSMEEAVAFAQSHSVSSSQVENHVSSSEVENPIVLLSTASPSYGMFKNFEEKGTIFARCIEKMAQER